MLPHAYELGYYLSASDLADMVGFRVDRRIECELYPDRSR